jgi:hypothetical protein
MLLWVFYKFIPEGNELLKLILNASGLAGAAAILGIFYNKTKNEIDRPKVTATSEQFSEEFKKDMEESLKKVSAKEALNNFVELFKKVTEEKTKDPIKFSDYMCSPFDHKEKVFVLQTNELIKDGYERECRAMLDKMELSSNYSVFDMPLSVSTQILTAKYPFDDPAAENKICFDKYFCKNKIRHGTDIKVLGYVIIYAYYNTEMYVSCWEMLKRDADSIERLKAYLNSKK